MIATVARDAQAGSAGELARVGLLLADTQAREYDEARVGFAEQARQGFAAREDQLWLTHVCMNAHVCARLEDAEQAAVLLDLIRPFTDLIAASPSLCIFSAAACAGMLSAVLGRDEEADRYFERALDLTTAFGAPYFIATAQIEWALALSKRGLASTHQTRSLVAGALATAREHGYAEIEREGLELEAAMT
jgi:hypothetical protein